MSTQKTRKWSFAQTWRHFNPPVRPGKGTLKIIAFYLDRVKRKHGKNTKVLILGSTPEFRGLVIKRGLVPYVVDYNPTTYRELGKLRTCSGKEIFIAQDWRELEVPHKFDIILGEASVSVTPKKDIPKLLKKISNYLKQDGYFLSKTWLYYPKYGLGVENIFRHFRRYHKGKAIYNGIAPLVYSLIRDRRTETLLGPQIYNFWEQCFLSGLLLLREFAVVKKFGYQASELQLYLPRRDTMDTVYGRYFKIIACRQGERPFGEYMPTYVLKKK